jgi:hypothetical protein
VLAANPAERVDLCRSMEFWDIGDRFNLCLRVHCR